MSLPTANQTIVGTCSICSGPVCVPTAYHSIVPPTPKCADCGATAKRNYGAVIPMEATAPARIRTWPSTDCSFAEESPTLEKINEYLKLMDAEPFKWPNEIHVEGIERRYVKNGSDEQQPGNS